MRTSPRTLEQWFWTDDSPPPEPQWTLVIRTEEEPECIVESASDAAILRAERRGRRDSRF